MCMRLHIITSLINSGLVTVMTSLAMTVKNTHSLVFLPWLTNWLVSWSIVFLFVYYLAPKIAVLIRDYLHG